jgi:predicted MPP superfamily phosphohydrolase
MVDAWEALSFNEQYAFLLEVHLARPDLCPALDGRDDRGWDRGRDPSRDLAHATAFPDRYFAALALKPAPVAVPMSVSVHVASDLHVELQTRDAIKDARAYAWPLAPHEDLFLAGDVGRVTDGSFLRALAHVAQRFRHVYVVLGNHEYYNSARRSMAEIESIAAAQVGVISNVTLLQRGRTTTAEGVVVLGCTLWTPLLDAPCADVRAIEAAVSDFKRIWVPSTSEDVGTRGFHGGSTRRLCARDVDAFFRRDRDWLLKELHVVRERNERVIVLTHHGPHPLCNPPEYATSGLQAAFVCGSADDVPMSPDHVLVAISGHTHGRGDLRAPSGVRLVAHCQGYAGEHSGKSRGRDRDRDGPFAPLALALRAALWTTCPAAAAESEE